MALGNLRALIALLEASGELTRVGELTDAGSGVANRTRAEQHRGAGKALLFERIDGYPGFAILTNVLGTVRRISMALGVDSTDSVARLAQALRPRIGLTVAPRVVDTDPGWTWMEAGQVDLKRLPIPTWSLIDGAPYVGTWHLNITKDPTTGIANAGVYRMMVLDKAATTVSVSPSSHLNAHFRKAEALGNSLEMAVAIGVAESLVVAAAAAIPEGQDEIAFAGGLQGAPVAMNRCRTIDCEVPADSEIVLEGRLVPGRREVDGPFFDYTGVASTDRAALRFEISCIRLAPGAVFRGAAIGLPGAEDHVLYSVLARLGLVDFHGSRVKRALQSVLFGMQWYRLVQLSGRLGSMLRTRGPGE